MTKHTWAPVSVRRGGLDIEPDGSAQRGGLDIEPNGLISEELRKAL
jgi:hypothetical protein